MPEAKVGSTKKRKPVRTFFKSFVNFKQWASYNEVTANTKTTWNLFRRLLYDPSSKARQETYEEAVVRLGLTPEQLIARRNNFLYSALIYLAFAVCFLIYFFYLLFHTRLLAAFLALIPMVLMLLAAYREHFWYMQMQRRRLGYNFHDWLDFVFRRLG